MQFYTYKINNDNADEFFEECKKADISGKYNSSSVALGDLKTSIYFMDKNNGRTCRSCSNPYHDSGLVVKAREDINFCYVLCAECGNIMRTFSSEAISATIKKFSQKDKDRNGGEEMLYKYLLHKDNIKNFYDYCKLRNNSPTYETNHEGVSKIRNLIDVLSYRRVCCTSCDNADDTLLIKTNRNTDKFYISCPHCDYTYDIGTSEAVCATIKWFADEEKDLEDMKYKEYSVTLSDGSVVTRKKSDKINGEKERKVMRKNKGFNLGAIFGGLEFGAVKGDEFKLSIYGVAFKNRTGKWKSEEIENGMCSMTEEARYVAYDKVKGELIDVDAINFDSNGLIMKMPVAMSQVAVGDIIIHQNNPVVVKNVRTDGNLEVIAPGVAEIKIIMPVKNMFGFNFYTKVMPLIDMDTFAAGANDDNPFGSLMPMMLMSSMMDSDNKMDPMMMMFMMNSMNGGTMDMQSMLPLMMLSGDNDMSDMMPLLMMQGLNGGEMDMNMMLPLMIMSKGDSDINPMILMMMMQGNMFGKKEEPKSIEDLKEQLHGDITKEKQE